jgi:hypothetical protein
MDAALDELIRSKAAMVVPEEDLPGSRSADVMGAAGGTCPDHEHACSHLVACASASAQVV